MRWETAEARFAVDHRQRIVEWDLGAAALADEPVERALGRPCYELVRGRDAVGRPLCGPDCPGIKAIRRGHLIGRSTLRFRRSDGLALWLNCELTSLPSTPGGALARMHTPASPGFSLAYDLAAIGTLITSLPANSLRESIERTLDPLREATGADAGEVFLAEPGEKGMVLTCHRGLFRHAFFEMCRFAPGEGYPGLELAHREPILTNRLSDDPRYLRSRVKELGFRSYVCVPLRGAAGTAGAIHLAFRRSDADLERVSNLLSWVSVPLGAAVEAGLARLRDTVHSCLSLDKVLQERSFSHTLEALLDKIVKVSRSQGGALVLLEPRGQGLAQRLTQGLVPWSSCPTLKGETPFACPALATGRGTVLSGARESWPPTCQHNPRLGSVCYCIPLQSGSEAVGLCSLYYHSLGLGPPTWNLAPLEAVGSAAGRTIREAWEHLQQQRGAETTLGRWLQQLEADVRGRAPAAVSPGSAEPPIAGKPAEAPLLDIRCFGPFEVYRQGTLISPESVHRRKALTLLKVLLVHDGRPLSKDALIELLWPEGDPNVRAGQLYVLVHELRQLLEPQGTKGKWLFIRNDGDRYYFSVQRLCRLDVREFRALVDVGHKAEAKGDVGTATGAYEAAVGLYRGDLLEEEPFADWSWQEREHLRETCLDVLKRLVALLGRSGKWAGSVQYLRRALRVDQLREELHRELMFALWATGRRDEAVRQYEVCKQILRQELDVAPLPETEELLQRLKAVPKPDAGP